MDSTPPDIVSEVSPVQPANAFDLISSMLEGMEIEVNPTHPSNAPAPITVMS